MDKAPEHTIEFLLAFDGHVHWLDQGYCLRFEIKRVETSRKRLHGLRYSFTLHDPGGKRLIGFDNAHGVAAMGSRSTSGRPRRTIGTGLGPTKAGLMPSSMPICCWRISFVRSDAF